MHLFYFISGMVFNLYFNSRPSDLQHLTAGFFSINCGSYFNSQVEVYFKATMRGISLHNQSLCIRATEYRNKYVLFILLHCFNITYSHTISFCGSDLVLANPIKINLDLIYSRAVSCHYNKINPGRMIRTLREAEGSCITLKEYNLW